MKLECLSLQRLRVTRDTPFNFLLNSCSNVYDTCKDRGILIDVYQWNEKNTPLSKIQEKNRRTRGKTATPSTHFLLNSCSNVYDTCKDRGILQFKMHSFTVRSVLVQLINSELSVGNTFGVSYHFIPSVAFTCDKPGK
jgi:hypothetical protein